MSRSVTTRFALDVNIIMAALQVSGPISDISQLATLKISATDPRVNAIRCMRGVAQQVVSGTPEYQVHVSPHVWETLEYKLVNPTVVAGSPEYSAWTAADAEMTIVALQDAFWIMHDHGWTFDVQPEFTHAALAAVVPASMRQEPFGIDNEDRKVLLAALSAAELNEWGTSPTVTFLVTNDGGLQGANEYVQKHYASFQGESLPFSFSIVLPNMVAALMEKKSAR